VGETIVGCSERKERRCSGLFPDVNGRGPDETQGGARVPFSGRPIVRNTVCRSRDRGCKGHRIL
jgi:hypothetical protein